MGNWRCISIFLLVVYLDIADQDFVEGRDSRDVLNENRKLPKAKGTIKTIECPEDGDVIDCIDFWKQPAFDNPLTKKFHESIQLKGHPISYPGALNESAKPRRPFHNWNKYGECPKGTIPIKRTQNNNNATIHHRKHPKGVSNAEEIHEYATITFPGGTYYGTSAYFNVWNPFVVTGPEYDEFSLAQIWVTSQVGGHETLNTIEAGWIVYPNQYGTGTRRFIFSTANGYTTGCYNVDQECRSFVVTHQAFSFACDIYFSKHDGPYWQEKYEIKRVPLTKTWFLIINNEEIGYWPPNLFNSLTDGATSIQMGGEIAYHAHADRYHTATKMGSGHFAEEEFPKASFIRDIMVLTNNYGEWEHLNRDLVTPIATFPNCYSVMLGPSGTSDHTFFYFGGPGGPDCYRI